MQWEYRSLMDYHASSSPSNIGPTRFSDSRGASDLSLNLFQSLDEYSSCVEPVSNSSYECRPSSSDETRAQGGACPRSIGDIWSHDSISTIDSGIHNHPGNDLRMKHAAVGFSDYSHMLGHSQRSNEHMFHMMQPGRYPGHFSVEQPPVILQLSNLIW